ncbi:MAG: carbon-nitrogen hydrolase family protein [Ignavibacteria bacterium]|nr:carbon-nitrogen hydrolase family protein [Ignavibacteria bacterium]
MAKKKPFKVAAVQDSPVFLNKKATVEKACELVAKANAKGAKLIVFPEGFIPAYPDWVWVVPPYKKPILDEMYSELLENAVSIPDDATKKLAAAAKKNKIFIAIGVNERNSEASNASLFNTLLYFDDKGNIIGKHRKLIPTGAERLVWSQGDGSTLNSFNTSFGILSGLLCWENFMPLARNALYSWGTQIHVTPTWDSSEAWLNGMKFIAKEGGMFLVNSCQAIHIKDIPNKYEFKKLYPEGKEWINPGNSCIISPKGQFIAEPLKAKKSIIYADIDMDLIASSKWIFDVTGHYARPDVFKFSINQKPNKMMIKD